MTAMRTKQHRATARRKAEQRALIAQARVMGIKRVLEMSQGAVWQHPDTAWRLIRTFVAQAQAQRALRGRREVMIVDDPMAPA